MESTSWAASAKNGFVVTVISLIESKVFHWNTVNVLAVTTLESMMPLAASS